VPEGEQSAIELIVNDRKVSVEVSPQRTLLSLLREDLRLTGAKAACGEGACGACTVLVDGAAQHACMVKAQQVAGSRVTTIEGLGGEGALHPLQRAFLEEGALQCGYCTPGMILAAAALLAESPAPSSAQVRGALAGNICRCCAYVRIERAVLRGARLLGEGAGGQEERLPQAAEHFDFQPQAPWDRVAPERREYFELLGDGLVVSLAHARFGTDAGPPAPGGHRAAVEAWLHVGREGRVSAFTGKVDMGQDNRTALSLIVARELGVEPGAVSLTMGDTDLCPFDIGTFGSRSLPDAGSALAAAAAGARKELLEMAAQRLDVPRQQLELEQGSVRVGGSGERAGLRLALSELLEGVRRLAVIEPPAASRVVQRSTHPSLRVGGRERVCGAQRFTSDVSLSGMLAGVILRPPCYGARLAEVDLSAAQELAGVSVVEAGELVALAAPDAQRARAALGVIRARWVEPEAFACEEGLAAHLRSHPVEVLGWQGAQGRHSGDLERALKEAATVVEATYTTSYIAHAALESRVALAQWQGDRVRIFTNTQQPFFVRYEVAAALGIPEERVRVIVPDIGGAFGGKHNEHEAIAAALLSRAAQAPVRVALSREEEFRFTYLRPAGVIDLRLGARADGTLCALEHHCINAGSSALEPPYRTEAKALSFQPAEAPLPQGPYRALAATDNTFARECAIDELADALHADPLQLRLANLADQRLAAALGAAAERAGWDDRAALAEDVGLGIACGLEKEGRVATCAQVRVSGGGEIELQRIVIAYDCGEIVNRASVESQLEGALVMGLGGALFEAAHFADGRLLNASLREYRVPRISDVPPIDLVLIDQPGIPPAGAGETSIIAIAPAIANAVAAACGLRLRALPLADALRASWRAIERRSAARR